MSVDQPGDRVQRYLALERQLLAWRAEHPEDTPEEDGILGEMDRVWYAMNAEERKLARAGGGGGEGGAAGG